MVVSIGLVALINDIIPHAATIRNQKGGQAIRMKEWPARFVVVRIGYCC